MEWMSEPYIPNRIVGLNRWLYVRGYNTFRDGNISVRDGDHIYMTPSKFRGEKGNSQLEAKDILTFNISSKERPEGLSTEGSKHEAAYLANKNLRAVIHCHAPHATALASLPNAEEQVALMGRFSEFKVYDLPPMLCDDVVPDPAAFKEQEVHSSLCPLHGVTTFAGTLQLAFERLERLETYAKIVLLMGAQSR